jgi:hypothetical protein
MPRVNRRAEVGVSVSNPESVSGRRHAMKAILSTLLLLGTSSVALARPEHRPAPAREHRVEARHPWPENDHRGGHAGNRGGGYHSGGYHSGGYRSVDPGYRFDRRWERPRYSYSNRWVGRGPIVIRPWGTTTIYATAPSTFVDQVVVTYDDGRVETLAVGRYVDPANLAAELGIDRSYTTGIVAYGRDASNRSVSFAI